MALRHRYCEFIVCDDPMCMEPIDLDCGEFYRRDGKTFHSTCGKGDDLITAEDVLESKFEVRAIKHDADKPVLDDNAWKLTVEHKCEKKSGTVLMDLAWVRCPWCSSQVPKKIRRVFSQGSSDAGA